MRRFLRPGRLVRCGDHLLVFDTYQPVAAVLGTDRLLSWPSVGPARGSMGRLLCGDATGLWAVDPPDGPLARIDLTGDVTTYPMTDAERLIGDPNGCWLARGTGWTYDTDDPPPAAVRYVGRDGTSREVVLPGPVSRLHRRDAELAIDYHAAGPRYGADGMAHYDVRTVQVPWPNRAGPAEGYDPVIWGSADTPVPGRCGGLVWTRRHGGGLGLANWNRQEALVGSAGGAPEREVVLDGRITAVSILADELWVTRLRPGPPAHPTADLLRIPAGTYEPEFVLSSTSLDITDRCPPPVPIDDAAGVERDALDRVTRSVTARRADVSIQQVRLAGSWPETVIQIVVRHRSRPGLTFVRDIGLFDEAGRPTAGHRYAAAHLIHDVRAVDHGLPPATECRPDREGLVPF